MKPALRTELTSRHAAFAPHPPQRDSRDKIRASSRPKEEHHRQSGQPNSRPAARSNRHKSKCARPCQIPCGCHAVFPILHQTARSAGKTSADRMDIFTQDADRLHGFNPGFAEIEQVSSRHRDCDAAGRCRNNETIKLVPSAISPYLWHSLPNGAEQTTGCRRQPLLPAAIFPASPRRERIRRSKYPTA
jgi:hypothetical protein